MTTMNPDEQAADWTEDTWSKRAYQCAMFLTVHQFLTERESREVYERLGEWLKNAKYQGGNP